MKCICVLGTDTEIGKTFVTAALARTLVRRGAAVGVYKPVASGALPGSGDSDADVLYAAARWNGPIERVCPQAFPAPLAPPIAARMVGRAVNEGLMIAGASWWLDQVEVLLIEGAGGVLSPISDHWTCLDFVEQLQRSLGAELQVLLVTENRLGVVNQALMAIEAIQRRSLPMLGVFMNQRSPVSNDIQSMPLLDSNMELLLRFSQAVEYFGSIETLATKLQACSSDEQ